MKFGQTFSWLSKQVLNLACERAILIQDTDHV